MILVNAGIWYALVVVLAASLCTNIVQAGLVVRWKRCADQYKGMWKDATKPIKPVRTDYLQNDNRSIQYEYLEGLD